MEINTNGELTSSEAFYNPNAVTVYKKIEGGTATYPAIKTVDLEWQLEEKRRLEEKVNKLQSRINQIIDNMSEDYWFNPNTEASTILEDLCAILDHNPVKTIEFNATINVTGSVDIAMSEIEDFDLDSFLADVISVDSYNGDVVIENFTIEDSNEM